MIQRQLETAVLAWLKRFPAVALLGPRQCGKSTLAEALMRRFRRSVYLDLEKPSDRAKLQDAESFFSLHKNDLVCLDEIQRLPEIFPLLRGVLDQGKRNGQLLILGSASRDLIRQSSETLAGRIGYLELTPFLLSETLEAPRVGNPLNRLWLRGGYPRSFLARNDRDSFDWRGEFIRTFLERDIPQLGFSISTEALRRFWMMCAHSHAQTWNLSSWGQSIGVSHTTARTYLNLLTQTFVVRTLKPHARNLKKRLIKSPKVYLRDSGILHTLLDIRTFDDLLGHPIYGASWEGFVIENLLANFGSEWRAGFYRTAAGNELDLIFERGNRRVAIECKASKSPQVSSGFWLSLKELNIERAWVVAPVDEPYPLSKNVWVSPLDALLKDKNLRHPRE